MNTIAIILKSLVILPFLNLGERTLNQSTGMPKPGLHIYVTEQATGQPLIGATITLVLGKDSVNIASDHNGYVSYTKLLTTKRIIVRGAMEGYITNTDTIKLSSYTPTMSIQHFVRLRK